MSGGDWSSAPDDVDAVDSVLSRKMADMITTRGLELDAVGMQRLREAAAEMEEQIGRSGHAHQQVPFISARPEGPVHANFELTRSPGNEHFKVTLSGAGLPAVDPNEDFAKMWDEMKAPQGGGVPVLVIVTLVLATLIVVGMLAISILAALMAG